MEIKCFMFSLSFPIMVNEGELMIHSSCNSKIHIFHPREGQNEITNLLSLLSPGRTKHYHIIHVPVCTHSSTIFKLQIEKLPASSQWVVALLARPSLPFQKVNVSLQTTNGLRSVTQGPSLWLPGLWELGTFKQSNRHVTKWAPSQRSPKDHCEYSRTTREI